MEDPAVPLERKLYGHPLARLLWRKAIRESSLGKRMGKSAKLGMRIRWQRERIILVLVCGRYQNGKKKTKSGPNVEDTYARRWFGRTNIIFGRNQLVGNSRTCMDDAWDKKYHKKNLKQQSSTRRLEQDPCSRNKVRSVFLDKRTQREAARTHRVDPQTHRKDHQTHRKDHRNLRPRSPAQRGVTTSSHDPPCLFGLHSARMRNKQRYGCQLEV